MSLFSLRQSDDAYGVLFDIGSGSVLTAIVHSHPDNAHPRVIWSHREHAPLHNIESIEQVSKSVITALLNAAMQFDSQGRKVLEQASPGAKISHLQSGISAPWSYTVTKTISYTQERSFPVTSTLIEELIKTAEEKISQELQTNDTLESLGLETITEATLKMLANGYRVADPAGEQAEELAISQANVVAQEYITVAITDTTQRVFAKQPHSRLSFMLMAYVVLQDLLPQLLEVGIVDVTYEATEMGIVRDGTLQYCTHTPFGSFSLAREIATVLSVPLTEAFGYLHQEDPLSFLESVSKAKKAEVEKVLDAYVTKIAELFAETGDELSIPKTIVLHADLHSEPLFLHLIERAAKRRTKSTPVITLITNEILKQTFNDKAHKEFFTNSSDTALLLSAMFFHKHRDLASFTYV